MSFTERVPKKEALQPEVHETHTGYDALQQAIGFGTITESELQLPKHNGESTVLSTGIMEMLRYGDFDDLFR